MEIHEERYVSGKGVVITATQMDGIDLKIGDVIKHRGLFWQVTGFEYTINLFGEINQPIDIRIKEIKLEDTNENK